MKISSLKQVIREAIDEVVAELNQTNESAPPNFPSALEKKLLKQYSDNPSKAYATMWTIHNKKNEGNQRVCEMWTAWEEKSLKEAADEEMDMENPAESKEVELAKKLKSLADELLVMHGVGDESAPEDDAVAPEPVNSPADAELKEQDEEQHDETNMESPEESKEVQIAREVMNIASELLSMHGASEEESGEEDVDDMGEPTQAEKLAEAKSKKFDKKFLKKKLAAKKKKKLKENTEQAPEGFKYLGALNSGIQLPKATDWTRFYVSSSGNYEKFMSPSLKVWYDVDSSG